MRRGLAALLTLMLVPACDRVFGLERDRVDAGVDVVTGRWMLATTINDDNGLPHVTEIPSPGATLTVQFGDEAPTEVSIDADGNFAFERAPGAPYRLNLDGDLQGIPLQLQHDAAHLELANRFAGRFDRAPVTQPTTLTFLTHAVPGTRVIQSTGLWTESPMGGDSIDWNMVGSIAGVRGLLDAGHHDRLWYLVRQSFTVGTTTTTYTAIAAEASIEVTLADGVPKAVPIAPLVHPLDACAKLVAHRVADLVRVMSAVPGSAQPNYDWNIMSIPAPELGPVGVLTLATEAETVLPATDAVYTANYRNPFPGTTPFATMGATVHRMLVYPGAPAAVLAMGDRVWTPIADCQSPVTLDPIQAIPGTVTFDGVELATDGATVQHPKASRFTLAWNLAASGPNDETVVTLYEVGKQGGTTSLTAVRSYLTTDRTVSVDTDALLASHYYLVRLDGLLGLPGAKQGDLRTIGYPYGTTTQFSRMFHVLP